jgi:hypothetical protein
LLVAFVIVGVVVSSAQIGLSAKLVVELTGQPLAPGQQVSITAEAQGEGLTYVWSLVGSGELLEQEEDRMVIYTAPSILEGKSAKAIVSVKVTNSQGHQVIKHVMFNITEHNGS